MGANLPCEVTVLSFPHNTNYQQLIEFQVRLQAEKCQTSMPREGWTAVGDTYLMFTITGIPIATIAHDGSQTLSPWHNVESPSPHKNSQQAIFFHAHNPLKGKCVPTA